MLSPLSAGDNRRSSVKTKCIGFAKQTPERFVSVLLEFIDSTEPARLSAASARPTDALPGSRA